MPNFNGVRQKHYGVFAAINFPDFYETLIQDGKSLSYAAAQKEVVDQFVASLGRAKGDMEKFAVLLREDLIPLVSDDEQCVPDISDAVESAEMMLANKQSHREIATAIFNEMAEHFDAIAYFEEEEYEYRTDGLVVETSYLGGACIVFVTDSNYVTYAKECSPCLPAAGDLDNVCGEHEGFAFMCLPPSEYEGVDDRYVPQVVEAIDGSGRKWYKRDGKLQERRPSRLVTARIARAGLKITILPEDVKHRVHDTVWFHVVLQVQGSSYKVLKDRYGPMLISIEAEDLGAYLQKTTESYLQSVSEADTASVS